MGHGKDFNELGQIYSGELVTESTQAEDDVKKKAGQDYGRAMADHYADEDEEKKDDTVEEKCEDEKDEETVEEEASEETDEVETVEEDEDVVEEEDEETVEEGLGDRIGATASAAKGAAGDWMGGVMDAMKGDVSSRRKNPKKKFEDTKRQRIFEAHLKKIKGNLSSFVTDLVKLKLMDENEAEAFAKGVYDQVTSTMTKANQSRALKGRKFRD